MIIAKLVFHYIVDLETVLKDLCHMLKKDGRLLFSVPHPEKTQTHFTLPTEEAIYVAEVGHFGLTLPMVHRSFQRLSDVLHAAGFDIEKSVSVDDDGTPKRSNILAKKK